MQERLPRYRRAPELLRTKTHASQTTKRSLEIIALIERYRFLSTSLILALTGGDRSHVQRHLQTLFHRGFVNRFQFPRIGNPGEFNYYLDNRASLELLAESGCDREKLDWSLVGRNAGKPYNRINFGANIDDLQGNLMFLNHELMISRFHAALELGCKATCGVVELSDWRQDSSLWHTVTVPALRFERGEAREDKSESERIPHRPDAFFTLSFPKEPNETKTSFFYEADRRHTTTPKHNRKLRGHFHYTVKQRLHREHYGVDNIRAVLIETTDEAWAKTLKEAAGDYAVAGHKPSALFWFAHSEAFTKPEEVIEGGKLRFKPKFIIDPKTIFQRVWKTPKNDSEEEPLSLLD